jgi:hypothetical protein
VAVLGAGHSAAGSLIELSRLAKESPPTRVIRVLRGNDPAKSSGGGANDKLAARGALGSELSRVVGEGLIEVQSAFPVSHIDDTAGAGSTGVTKPRGA